MIKTLTLHEDAIPIVKSGLEMKRNALSFNTHQYRARVAAFEEKHKFTSEEFEIKFKSGQLGDNADWFEWEYLLDALRETKRQLELLAGVEL
ncbi:MAG: hypothetical protein HY070_11190 [Chloroflexi bacterium]|nr:hypothetical protein [Chloroflexota bacterium]